MWKGRSRNCRSGRRSSRAVRGRSCFRGSSPAARRIIDSTGALDLEDVPKSLLVVGGGYIGLELGSAYAAMGSKVSVVEMTEGLLPGCDRDLVSVLKRRLDKKFEEILLKTKVVELKEQKNGVAVTLEDKKGGAEQQTFREGPDRDRPSSQY